MKKLLSTHLNSKLIIRLTADYKYGLFSLIIPMAILLSSCKNEQEPDNKEENLPTINYSSTAGWNIPGNKTSEGKFAFQMAQESRLYTGQIFFAIFKDSLWIKSMNLIPENKTSKKENFDFRLYVNNSYHGRYSAFDNIRLSEGINSIRILFVKTGKEKICRGWDHQYNYESISDTSTLATRNLRINIQLDTLKHGKLQFQKQEADNQIKSINLKIKEFEYYCRKPFITIKKSRNQNTVTEHIIEFSPCGQFNIIYLQADRKSKQIKKEIHYTGIYQPNEFSQSRKIFLQGEFIVMNHNDKDHEQKQLTENAKFGINSLKLNLLPDSLIFEMPAWAMVDIHDYDSTLLVDIPYATEKNITGKKLYACNKCYLRYTVVKSLMKVRKIFLEKGVDIKMLDCYRPLAVQKILYEAFPVPGYVADTIGGSIHNRGTAVDLTLTDLQGKELEMGSAYDELSFRSNINFKNLPDSVIRNRFLLRETMSENGFVPIKSEWWHFESAEARKYPKTNDPFPCDYSPLKAKEDKK